MVSPFHTPAGCDIGLQQGLQCTFGFMIQQLFAPYYIAYCRWHSTNYTFFWGMTLGEGVRFKLGTKRPVKTVKQMASMHVSINDVLPENFDGRVVWADLITPIQDQGNCGASWAFSTTSRFD